MTDYNVSLSPQESFNVRLNQQNSLKILLTQTPYVTNLFTVNKLDCFRVNFTDSQLGVINNLKNI